MQVERSSRSVRESPNVPHSKAKVSRNELGNTPQLIGADLIVGRIVLGFQEGAELTAATRSIDDESQVSVGYLFRSVDQLIEPPAYSPLQLCEFSFRELYAPGEMRAKVEKIRKCVDRHM